MDVVHGGAEHQSQEGAPLTLIHASRNTEVEEGDLSIRKNKEVSTMKIAMEDSLDDCAFHEADHSGTDDFVGVNAGSPHCFDVVEIETREPFHNKHSSGHERWVRARNDVAVLFEGNKRGGNVEHVLRFEAEIEFLADCLGEEFDKCRWVSE
ncbi:unannotated protein [freshwater metagenome]|uniref:Unannotated protein n=1 Tax=freshwater metagenome TaxID=449393 RepID=A0A6J6AS28_9ZZZZ